MKLTAKGNTNTIEAGVHLVTVSKVVYLENSGKKILNKNKDYGYSIEFETKDDQKEIFSDTFWFGPKTWWRLDKLLKAIDLPNDDRDVYAKEMIGKTLWICVQEKLDTVDGEIKETGYEIFDFRKCVNEESKPAMLGDPARGDIGGSFIETVNIESESLEPIQMAQEEEDGF